MSATEVNGTITFRSNGDSPVILREVAEMVEGFQRLQLPVAVTITVTLDGEMTAPVVKAPAPTVKEAPAATVNFPAPVPDADGASGVDWSSGNPYLSPEAWLAVTDLENGVVTWRQTKKRIRLELIQAVLAQPTEGGEPMTTVQFDRVKPAWMSKAGNLTTMFGCSWPELPTLRLSE